MCMRGGLRRGMASGIGMGFLGILGGELVFSIFIFLCNFGEGEVEQ